MFLVGSRLLVFLVEDRLLVFLVGCRLSVGAQFGGASAAGVSFTV